MGIEDEEYLSGGYGYGYGQQKYTMAQQNYTTCQPSYTMAQQNYNVAQQNGYDDNSYYAGNDDNGYNYASNIDRRYVSSHAGVNRVMPSSYDHEQQYQMNNRPVAVYAQRPSGWGWGSNNSHQYSGNRAPKHSDPGYDHVRQNSCGGYQSQSQSQSEWMYKY